VRASTRAAPRPGRRPPRRAEEGDADPLGLAEEDEILGRIPSRSFRFELEEREALGERLAQVALRVVRAAEVRARQVAPAADELAPLARHALVGVASACVRISVCRAGKEPAGADNSGEVVARADP